MLKNFLSTVSLSAILAGSAVFASAGPPPSINTNFSNIYYFGDSLTDGRDKADGGIYPTGDVWAKKNSEGNNIGYDLAQNNFARVSARTTEQSASKPGIVGTNFNQITNFLNTAQPILSDDLFAFWIGHNDIENSTAMTSAAFAVSAGNAATNIKTAIERLIAGPNNAKNFLILNLADFAFTPQYINAPQATRNAFTFYAQTFNSAIQEKVNEIASSANIILLDFLKLEYEVVANPGAFIAGATSSNDFFLSAADDTLVNVHPTAQSQRLIGAWVSDLISAPLPFVIFPDFAISLMDRNTQSIFARQNYLKHHCHDQSGIRFYAEGNLAQQNLKKSANPFNTNSDAGGLAAGVEYQTADKSTLGVKLSYDQNSLKFKNTGHSLEKADIKETTIALYGFLFPGDHLNLAGSLAYGSLDVDTTRVQTIGINRRTESGNGSGEHITAAAQVGFDFNPTKYLTLTPYSSIAYHHVKHEDIKEKSNSSTSLVIKPPSENALFYRFGTEFLGHFDVVNMSVDPFINLAAVHERRSRSNKVQARSTSFTRSFTLESSKVMSNDTYMEGIAGINIGLSCKDTLSVKYGGKFFTDKQTNHFGTISYTREI